MVYIKPGMLTDVRLFNPGDYRGICGIVVTNSCPTYLQRKERIDILA